MVNNMDDALMYVLNYAFNHRIGFMLTYELTPDAPSSTVPRLATIVVNMNLRNKKEIPFQVAHEIGHILNGDINNGVLYHTTFTSHSKIELCANNRGIDILLEYCDSEDIMYDNYLDFIEDFGIPHSLTDLVKLRMTRWIKEKVG